ncbi:MAG TPA: MBL fold metallo-hydrolase [Actinomycetota bacterium]|nr:MBL fold metallo-hydrolase [Actinomycetota bacterium]
MSELQVDLVRTTGIFSLAGQDFEVEDNIWLVGDEREVLVVDAAHDASAITERVGGRKAVAIVCTHGHNDHINAAPELADALAARIGLHPADRMLWDQQHPDRGPDFALSDGDSIAIAGATLEVIHTPGHTPGGVCLYDSSGGRLFGGDTLFQGGPGATGRDYSDFEVIISSIRDRLLTLPEDTVVYPGHGETTTIGAEAPHLQEWIDRGY